MNLSDWIHYFDRDGQLDLFHTVPEFFVTGRSIAWIAMIISFFLPSTAKCWPCIENAEQETWEGDLR